VAVSISGTPNSCFVLTEFSSISCGHYAFLDITLATPVRCSISCVVLFASTSIEAGVVVGAADDEFDFTLQSSVTHGTQTVHSIVLLGLFPRKFIIRFHSGEGSKFSMPVYTSSTVEAV
jgi:hypothetical protein